MLHITIGGQTLSAVFEDNRSATELRALLQNGPMTMSAENYGGFEKVCALGTTLPRSDSRITTQAGDIMLYSGDQIVLFYGSNTWAYTPLAHIAEEDLPALRDVLSGSETEVTISLA